VPAFVYIDGEVLPADRACVPIFDRGFLYGDGVYEVLRTYDGHAFALGEHLTRLHRSGELLGIAPFPCRELIEEAIRSTLARAACSDAYVRAIVTRGSGPISLDPGLADEPRLVVLAKELVPPPAAAYENGIEVAIVAVLRHPRDTLDPRAKSGNYLTNIMALRDARARGADEALMLNAAGQLAEGASSNVFVVRDGSVATPPVAAGILEGITRRFVLRLAALLGLRAQEIDLSPADLTSADEAFITSSAREVVPVTRCDGQPIGSGEPGPVTRRLLSTYRAEVARSAAAATRRSGRP